MITPTQLLQIAPSTGSSLAPQITDALNKVFSDNTINDWTSVNRRAGFIAQVSEESGYFHNLEENLNYSANALVRVWPRHFTPADALVYQHQPEKIANRAYALRIGNGDEASGDGWKYHGRGYLQLTGKSEYQACGLGICMDLENHPELLLQAGPAMESAVWYWTSNHLNTYADHDDIVGMTKAINGGTLGLQDRTTLYNTAKAVLA